MLVCVEAMSGGQGDLHALVQTRISTCITMWVYLCAAYVCVLVSLCLWLCTGVRVRVTVCIFGPDRVCACLWSLSASKNFCFLMCLSLLCDCVDQRGAGVWYVFPTGPLGAVRGELVVEGCICLCPRMHQGQRLLELSLPFIWPLPP